MNDANEMMVPLGATDTFAFSCGSAMTCFNECCRDLNQFLTPYDVLRIKQGLGMSSTRFIETYCRQHMGPESGFPVLTLKPADTRTLVCPFVTPDGCRIYADRPSSCRMYPLARAISRSRETGRISEYFMLIKEPHCLGCHERHTQTVEEWIRSQELPVYNEMNDRLMEIIALKNRLVPPGPLDLKAGRFFFLTCYDLDAFRYQLFNTQTYQDIETDAQAMEQAKTDDVALLKIGMAAVTQFLIKEYGI